jgi:predicted signal transduction protein with EAL and GGDEF domain
MIFIYRKGCFLVFGVFIYLADVALIAAGVFKPDAHLITAICFFAPALVPYLFFKPNYAFFTATASYVGLSYFYLQIFFGDGHPYYSYAPTLIISQGIANLVSLHLVGSSRHAIEKKLMDLAHSDALTGLPNRLHFESRIEQEIERCKREYLPLCFSIIDLDFFKQVNDKHGHDCGDMVLIHVANLLTNAVRAQDIACRLGGEELVIIMHSTE